MTASRPNSSVDPAYLQSAPYVDSAAPSVIRFAERAGGDGDKRDIAMRLYYAVRDDILYDPYVPYDRHETYRASDVLAAGRGYCVGKAALLAAAARARGIPARVAFADVRNHLSTPRLLELAGSDLFVYHGITELWRDGKWVKATPTFNIGLCDRFGIKPLDFDGVHDATLHPYDKAGRQHMEYVREHGSYADVPIDALMKIMRETYPRIIELAHAQRGDFAAEAEIIGRGDRSGAG
jgi:transglutaminase-like putative cysteine protease